MYMGLNHNSSSNCKHIITEPSSYDQSFKDDCYYNNSETNTLFEYDDYFTTRQTLLNFEKDYASFDSLEDKRMNKDEQ